MKKRIAQIDNSQAYFPHTVQQVQSALRVFQLDSRTVLILVETQGVASGIS